MMKERRSKLRKSSGSRSRERGSSGAKQNGSSNRSSKASSPYTSNIKSSSPLAMDNNGTSYNRSSKKSPSVEKAKNGHNSSNRQKSPSIVNNCQCSCPVVHHNDDTEVISKKKGQRPRSQRPRSQSRSQSRSKSSLAKKVSFDETPPVEISSRETSNDYCDDEDDLEDEIEEDMLPELQEDDLFSTYESLKAHASPSPPPALLWTDLSKGERKTLAERAKVTPPPPTAIQPASRHNSQPRAQPQPQQLMQVEKETATAMVGDVHKPITFRELDVSFCTLALPAIETKF